MRNDPTSSTSPDSIQQLKADMAADPDVRPILDQRVRDAAAEFIGLAVSYANKWFHTDDPWLGEQHLLEASIWLREAHKSMDRELAAKQGPKSTVAAFKR